MATHKFVLPTQKNFDKSFRKLDLPRKCPSYKDLLPSIKIFRQRHASVLVERPGFQDVEYNPKSSPGFTLKINGIKTKAEAQKTQLLSDLITHMATPLAQASPKNEAMSMDDIMDYKIRTFFAMDMHHCVNQWFLFDQQETRYIELCKTNKVFGQYGFSKQYGGFHRLGRGLTRPTSAYKLTIDVSGYDRVNPLLPFLYKERVMFLSGYDQKLVRLFDKLFEQLEQDSLTSEWLSNNLSVYPNPMEYHEVITNMAWHQTLHSCFTLVIDADGYVVLTTKGNRSGNPNTTSDNTMTHEIIEIDLQRHLQHCKRIGSNPDTYDFPYFDDLGVDPNAEVYLFGDDNIKSYPQELVLGNDLNFIRRHYARFGFVIKETAVKESYSTDPLSLEGFEFLGSTFSYHKLHQKWYPTPREGKIASSILYSQNQDIDQYAQRIIGLANVSYGHPFLFSSLLEIMQLILKNYPSLSQATTSQMFDMLETATLPETIIFGFE